MGNALPLPSFESVQDVRALETTFFSSGCESCQKEQVLPPCCVVLWGKSQQQTAFLGCAALTPASLSLDGGDKDARDSVQMWLEQRLRDGLEDGSVSGQQIGTFERYTKVSFGYVLRSGWGKTGRAVVAALKGCGLWRRRVLGDEDGLRPPTLTFFSSPRALAGRCWSSRAGRKGRGWGAATLEWPKLWTTRVRIPDARGGWGKYSALPFQPVFGASS